MKYKERKYRGVNESEKEVSSCDAELSPIYFHQDKSPIVPLRFRALGPGITLVRAV